MAAANLPAMAEAPTKEAVGTRLAAIREQLELLAGYL